MRYTIYDMLSGLMMFTALTFTIKHRAVIMPYSSAPYNREEDWPMPYKLWLPVLTRDSTTSSQHSQSFFVCCA
ncbi:hypothetical protein BDY19DRAFT_449594 [Irpex rosettiformis]|uniref:Uncharacterized protein n=1 Tax=Irpex rosettiformis TaxID=378272 RepID=A0ACB8TTS3_9APHY|nr:hypothetical protein BDY19DRAFT_449594 [Irpex rosettiformis]